MTATTLLDFGDEPYVLLTTFRANGDRVGTPVWVARDSDHLVVMTAAGTGKVKRIERNALVELTLPEDANIYASQYQLYLPSKEELQQKLRDWTSEGEED